MIPEITTDTKPIEFYKAFNDMCKPPTNHLRQGTSITDSWFNLSRHIGDDLQLGRYLTITDVQREPVLNRLSVCFDTTTGDYTDHAGRLDDMREIKNLSNGRPLIIEVTNAAHGSSLYMTPATVQMVAAGIYIVYNGKIYRADKVNNINLLYAIYSEFYFLKFSGNKTEDGEFRSCPKHTRLAFFYKPENFNKIMTKYGIRDGIC